MVNAVQQGLEVLSSCRAQARLTAGLAAAVHRVSGRRCTCNGRHLGAFVRNQMGEPGRGSTYCVWTEGGEATRVRGHRVSASGEPAAGGRGLEAVKGIMKGMRVGDGAVTYPGFFWMGRH